MSTEMGGLFGLFALVPIILYLFIIAFGIYFTVRAIRFMNEKTQLDQARNEKLDALIKVMQEKSRE
ncbi:hypothetical protein [Neobacillus sp. NPDC093127]|uniref:hypothetical protein n=1 Tax=Neobacillus sp. NPDC093127 TaxID=3364296 RepID=UPI0038027A38